MVAALRKTEFGAPLRLLSSAPKSRLSGSALALHTLRQARAGLFSKTINTAANSVFQDPTLLFQTDLVIYGAATPNGTTTWFPHSCDSVGGEVMMVPLSHDQNR